MFNLKNLIKKSSERETQYFKAIGIAEKYRAIPGKAYNWIKGRWEERFEKEKKQKEFKKEYPERYKEIVPAITALILPDAKEKLITKGKLTQEEAELFSAPEVWGEIGAMKIVSGKAMTKVTARQILKLGKKATQKEITSAYRSLAHQYHPDIPGGKKTSFKLVKEAYDTLLKGVEKKATPNIINLLKGKIAPRSPLRSQVKNLKLARYGEVQAGLIDSRMFVNKIEQGLSKHQREIIPFMREGTVKVTKELKPWVDEIGKYFDEGYDFLKQNYNDVGFVKNYVNRVWDVPKSKVQKVGNYFNQNNPFVNKQRKILTLEEGKKLGLKPKTTDVAELIKLYDYYKHTVVANKKFAEGLNKLVSEDGQKLVQRMDKAPADWKVIDHPALSRAIGTYAKEGEGLMFRKLPVKVHPEIVKEIEAVLGTPFSGKTARAMNTIFAFTKKSALSLSFFHHFALTESAISAGIGKQALKMWNPIKVYNAIKKGRYDIFEKAPMSKDAVRHGLQLGAISDVQRSKVSRALGQIEYKTKKVAGLNKLTTGIRKFNEVWDKGLWDYYHNGLKLYTYEKWLQESIQKFPKKDVGAIKKTVAQLVNDTFGGQIWEQFAITPQGRQILHWTLLSPDWTLSTLRQVAAPFQRGARGKLGRDFWLRAGLFFGAGSNVVNYAMTKHYTGEGKWMWENDPKHKTYIFIGFDENRRKKYLRFGKQFREAYEWATNPIKKFGSKLAPVTREVYKQISGYSPTGWKQEWADKDFWDPEALKERAKSLASLGKPYSISTTVRSKNLLGLAMPISKGLSWYESRELMIDAIERQDKDYMIEIWRASLENNLNAKDIYNAAKIEMKQKEKLKYGDVEDLLNKLMAMPSDERVKKYQEMKESGEVTPQIEKQLKYIREQRGEVKKQREQIRI